MQKLEIENYIARSLKVFFSFYTQISDTNFLNTLFPL